MEVDTEGIRIDACPIYMELKGEEGQYYLGKRQEGTFLNENLKGDLLVVKWRKDEKGGMIWENGIKTCIISYKKKERSFQAGEQDE